METQAAIPGHPITAGADPVATSFTPAIRQRGDCRAVAVLGHRYAYLATGADTGGAYTLLHADIPAADPGVPPHMHHREDEAFYILEGQVTFVVGDRTLVAGSGAFILAPRGIPHAFRNTGPGPARLLVTITPSGFEAFFDEIGDDWTGRKDMPPPPDAERIARVLEAAPRYGLELHPPG